MIKNSLNRILFLTDCLATLEAGAEKQIYELARWLDKNRYSLIIVSLDVLAESLRAKIESRGCGFKIFPVKRIYGLPGIIQGIRFFKLS